MEKSVDPMLVLGKAVDFSCQREQSGACSNYAECSRDWSETQMSVKVRGGYFPLGALPMKIQRIIREANDCYGYPVDYLAGAMLVAVGLGIGNTHFARLKGKWDESAILFMALVGRPGACKSHPLNFAIRPFSELDGAATRAYIKACEEYERQRELPMKERSEPHPVAPVCKRFLISDATPEAMLLIHSQNLRGIAMWNDELAGWFKNFNRYNKGSDEEYWLKMFNANPSFSDRKGVKNSVYISRPFISVVGTIQNGILNELAHGSRSSNGFIDRLLFVMPHNQDKQPWSDKEPTFDIEAAWAQIIERLVAIPYETDTDGNVIANILPFAPDAKARLYEWQRRNTEECNREECDALKGVYNKFDFHAIRFCLILQMARWACGEADRTEIDLLSVENAISLVDYFKSTARKVHGIISEMSLTEQQRAIIADLPDSFTTEEGIAVAKENGMPGRTFQDFLKRSVSLGTYFQREKHGHYSKL